MVGSQSIEKSQTRQEKRSTILNQCLEVVFVSSRRLIVGTGSLLRWSLDLQDRLHSGLPGPFDSSFYWGRQGHSLARYSLFSLSFGLVFHLLIACVSFCLSNFEF